MLTYLIPSAKEMTIPKTICPHTLSAKSSAILQKMSQMTTTELAFAYKIRETAADKEYLRWQAMTKRIVPAYPAIQLFNGLMYRHLNRKLLSKESPVYITSSFYGIIQAVDPIAEHRLDFQTKIRVNEKSLKAFWRADFDAFAEQQKTIISLLSSEFTEVFSAEVRKLFVSITFMEEKKGQLRCHSTISKKARGAFLTQALKDKAKTIDDLKRLSFDGFSYSDQHSQQNQLTFIKKDLKN